MNSFVDARNNREQSDSVQTRRGIRDEVDRALRNDVRELGALLGRVIQESGGPELLHDVEQLRTLTIRAHEEGSGQLIDRAEELVASMSDSRAEDVARAFTCYFHLSNLAEEHHRVRQLRQRTLDDIGHGARDSLPAAIERLADEVGPEEAQRRLSELRFHPVLTAHPTEARRRAVASSIRRISEQLTVRDNLVLGSFRDVESQRRLLEEIETLWRTAPVRTTRPTPLDEVRTAMNIFDQTLFQVVPRVYRLLDDWILGQDAGTVPPAAPAFLRLGSWIGGDRDGNPFVTAKITRQAAAIASEHVLLGLEHAVARVGRTLTLDEHETPPTTELLALWRNFSARAESIASEIATRSPGEPHRRVLLFIAERIAATRKRDADLAYREPAELAAELATLQHSLRAGGAHRNANGEVQSLIWQLETFGFHLAQLEVRQHSQVHRSVLDELRAGTEQSELATEVLEVFSTVAFLQQRYGPESAGRYIVSFTQSAEDLANVYELAERSMGAEAPVLDVVPLFETFADLDASTTILEQMLEIPQVQARLEQTGRTLEVMLGYSDSSKDVGPVSATLALYSAQQRIAAWARTNSIKLTLFHGRGGALGRGGGPANEAVLAQPAGSVEGRFKLTEQGEVIFARYGDETIAARHIEQMAAATLLASSPSNEKLTTDAAERYAGLAKTLDSGSRARFFELIKAPGFPAWFAQVTPLDEVGLLALGSRPARRGLSVESLADLRAIPWVFAWTQARINLAGWFGLGSALREVGDEALLHEAYTSWPLFTALIDNVEMSLAKTDARIAAKYLALGDRDDLAELILAEMELTREWVARTTKNESLLEGRPVLRRAVRLRSPYVDALSLLQLRALKSLRSVDGDAVVDPASLASHQHLLLLAVNGVAAGLQNTG